ncbi:hypothetical protein BGZ80_003915, partial [Entomortierella chlamydospora]
MTSTRASRRNKTNNWQQEFSGVNNHEYFDELTDPRDITHLQYFEYCYPRSVDKLPLHRHWSNVVLPIIEKSKNRALQAQYKRLKNEWEDTVATEPFWEKIEDMEFERAQKRIERKHQISLEEHAADQLQSAFIYLTKKMKQHHKKLADDLDDVGPTFVTPFNKMDDKELTWSQSGENDEEQADEEQEDDGDQEDESQESQDDKTQSSDVNENCQLSKAFRGSIRDHRLHQKGHERPSSSGPSINRLPRPEPSQAVYPANQSSAVDPESVDKDTGSRDKSKIHELVDTDPKMKHRIARPLTEKGRRSFSERYKRLGKKWVLQSGTVVEDVLFEAGSKTNCDTYRFMLDLDDPSVKRLFSLEDWKEITAGLPSQEMYSDAAAIYLDSFCKVKTSEELEKALQIRPNDAECQLIYYCLVQWLDIYKTTDPSPFSIVNTLGGTWWLNSAWGICSRLTNGIPYAFMIPVEKPGHQSSNRDKDLTKMGSRCVGYNAELSWRTPIAPERDWAVVNVERDLGPQTDKNRYEGTL